MSEAQSDALVFFGPTGDLAYKKIFPSLQAMLKRGNLNVPIIGVAKSGWNLDQFRHRPVTASRNTAELILRRLTSYAAYCVMLTGTTRSRQLFIPSAKSSGPPDGQRTTLPSLPHFSRLSWKNWQSRAAPKAPALFSKSHLAETSPRHGI